MFGIFFNHLHHLAKYFKISSFGRKLKFLPFEKRYDFLNKIISIAKKNKCVYQLEVEGVGGSDAKELQMAEYPWDWCFIGAAEENVHTPDEKVHKKDVDGMIKLYEVLMKEL